MQQKTNETVKTNRQLALEWWNELDSVDTYKIVNRYFLTREPSSLTGREIEQIWEAQYKESYDYTNKFIDDFLT